VAPRFDHFAKLFKHLICIEKLSVVGLLGACPEFRLKPLKGILPPLLVTLQKSQRLSDHFN
jgi:hypothetical protein